MQYKIVNLRLKNFKCFDSSKYYEFKLEYEKNPVILSGPNGFGKTTFFDAVELIFSKDITRLDKGIEKKNTNLGKNILLNRANKDGYVVLTLKNEDSKFLTLFAKILNTNHKIEVENAVYYGEIKKYISTDELDEFIEKYKDWKDKIDDKELIKYRADNFNVYYYVSQADSVHFLKRTIVDRKNAMNVLLNTGSIDERKGVVARLIGSKNGTTGYPVNDEIIDLENEINRRIIKLKELVKNIAVDESQKREFIDLALYQIDKQLFYWDNLAISKSDVVEIKKGIKALLSLISFLENESDYRNHVWNTDIFKLFQGKAIEDYVNYKMYIIHDIVSIEKAQQEIDKWDTMVQIYSCSLLFRQEIPDAESYKEEDIVRLKELVPELAEYDFSLIRNIVNEICNLKSMLSTNQKVMGKLMAARQSLRSAKNEYDQNGAICPFCHTNFSDSSSLNDAFEEATKLLQSEAGNVTQIIVHKNKELVSALEMVRNIIKSYIDGVDENSVQNIIKKKTNLQKFINDSGNISSVEKVAKYLKNVDLIFCVEDDGMILEIQRVLSGLIKKIENDNFENLYTQHEYEMIEVFYGEKLSDIKRLTSIEKLTQKKNYLEAILCEKENVEIHAIQDEVRKLIVRKDKITKVRKKLNDLNKLYDKKIDEYKNMTLKNLRVPLLIYTGKILQDYQNGLGVFVSKDEMRFVSNGDAKHDILNTFSSGQLSGFVLAFLFAMNKQYIKKSTDDIGFILIDDPVQTMDDINIASLIEVLRNDFSEKQIILSTHEMDKENYILYKFMKYNQLGQSFNVKEEIYGV